MATTLLSIVLALLNAYASRTWWPVSMQVLVIMLGGFLLGVRPLALLYLVITASMAFMYQQPGVRGNGPVILLVVAGAIVLWFARSRARLGVQGTRGDSMLVDLRDRLRAQGEMPALPDGWAAEIVLRSAGGSSFSGDFLVSSRHDDVLEVALVDVSGKGVDAGSRALLLSGAFGGLLGSTAPDVFLASVNSYLLRQNWDEGFATMAYAVIDLSTGGYRLSTAGHPPCVHYQAGSGQWRLRESGGGPLLGVFADADFAAESGRLERGDALLMFTDGLIETPGQDIAVGIDKLLGQAERLIAKGFEEGARTLLDRVAATHNDDRAVLLIWRT